MKSVDAVKGTFDTLLSEIKKIDTSYSFDELDATEGRAVRALQLMEAQIGEIGAELYSVIKMRRADIAQGKIGKNVKEEAPKAPKPAAKKKKSSK